ncbi:autotransporter assembly complex protein TamA [Sphingomonas abietis]|uniref:BamA/TamA family outer membrane protein n=1 Tax=Sphingomonas abietis TaxID=3012344 RepID=A0ABY7NR59_9SPHN|nr:BamA/TamA family outer membrane protein [Sphingomonas abietis]WBO24034.1 BamA/TamA family outer membrane protein [Sphingomonas abietis]
MSVLAFALVSAAPAFARHDNAPSPEKADPTDQAVDPAIDPSFDAALPPLDAVQAPPAVGAPTQAVTTQAVTAQPGTPPAVAQPASMQPAPAQATADPELAQPLPPLAGFDPTPDTSKASVPSTEETRIRYTVKVEGLSKIGLEDEFRSLSELDSGKKKAANSAQVAARAKDDVALAEKILRSEGYYDGVASSTVAAVPGQPGQVAATISVTPGPRYVLSSIAVTGAAPEPTTLATAALTSQVQVGKPIRSIAVEGGEAQISLQLPERGFPFAKVGQRDILLDDATHGGDYTVPLEAGPKSSFGRVRPDGKGATLFTEEHLAVFPRFKPGDLYDSRKTDDLRQALVATGIFSTVAIQPIDTGQKAADGTEITDLLVTEEKGPWRTLAGSGGYGTGEGIKAEASWTHRNLFPPEGALTVSVIGGTLEQGANVAFRRSNAGQRDKTFQIVGGFDRSNYDAYEAKSINLAMNWSRQSTPIWQKRWTYTYGAELIGTNEKGAALDATGDRPRRNYLIGALPVQVEYDRSDDLLNPTRGFRILARISPEASIQSGFKTYARLTGQGTAYYPIGKSVVLAGRVLVASIQGANLDDIAPSRRIYVGGGGSVRGYGYQQLGPKDAQNNPTGGLSSTEFALEARYRFGNFGVVPFFDGGRLGQTSSPSISHMRYGAGIGGRYYTNFGPLRLDVATPIARQPGESKITLYISIGQAF